MTRKQPAKKPVVERVSMYAADDLDIGKTFTSKDGSVTGTIVGYKLNSDGTAEVSISSIGPEQHIQVIVISKDDLIPPTVPSDAVAATATLGPNVFTAVTPGVIGNSIALIFDGLLSVQAVTDSWNLEYADNQVSFTGDGLTIPLATTVTLSGGVDAVLAPEDEVVEE